MFHSDHTPGSDAWYEALETWMVSERMEPTAENIAVEVERFMVRSGQFVPADYRFLRVLPSQAARKAS